MSVSIRTQDACVDFPVFDAKSRSLKRAVMGSAGGKVMADDNVVVVEALRNITMSLNEGDRVGLVGHNGAGKSTLIKILSGAYKRDAGSIFINGEEATINNPRDAKGYGIETIYQTLALADNVDAAANLFLGRELRTAWGTLDDVAMEAETRKVMGRLNPRFQRFIGAADGQHRIAFFGDVVDRHHEATIGNFLRIDGQRAAAAIAKSRRQERKGERRGRTRAAPSKR